MQQIPYHCKLHAITDLFGLEAFARLYLIFWYVSFRVRFNFNTMFTRVVLCYSRYFILLLLSSLNKLEYKTVEKRIEKKKNKMLGVEDFILSRIVRSDTEIALVVHKLALLLVKQ